MYRVQLWVKVSDARENAILGSWLCTDKEDAENYAAKLKKKYRNSAYTIKIFEV